MGGHPAKRRANVVERTGMFPQGKHAKQSGRLFMKCPIAKILLQRGGKFTVSGFNRRRATIRQRRPEADILAARHWRWLQARFAREIPDQGCITRRRPDGIDKSQRELKLRRSVLQGNLTAV